MAHRHLILAYVATWGIQLGYVAFLALRWRTVRAAERREPGYGAPPE
jgi:hypothetical protein